MKKKIHISAKQAKKIYDIACMEWKHKLFNIWGNNLVEAKDIEISYEFFKTMLSASNVKQREIINQVCKEFNNHSLPLNTRLFTKDGRKIGNAIIIKHLESEDNNYLIKTDYGNDVTVDEIFIRSSFYIDFEEFGLNACYHKPHKYSV